MPPAGQLIDCISKLGFRSIMEYVSSRPEASLSELARALDLADIATMQLERRFVEEAQQNGEAAVERCARILVVRDLRNELRFWWPTCAAESMPVARRKIDDAFTSLMYTLPMEYGGHCERVRRAIEPALLAGWLPEDEEEPMLLAIFEEHWKDRITKTFSPHP